MTQVEGTTQKFAAFMSYAHADEGIAGRLHNALETYRLPKAFRAHKSNGQDAHPLKPIFRDVADLTAHHSLSDKIRDAVSGSRYMIVLCSPAAKASHWVNAEIRYFRELHGDDNILSVLASGTPTSAFPEALTEGGREPLAADISGDKAGFRLGVTQLAAAMLGTGLDDLVRRDERRRTRRFQTGMLASLVFSGVMAGSTLTAMDARKEAEANRADAEVLVEYMITDLKDKLEPLGKLDVLDGVVDEVLDYYRKQDFTDMPNDRRLRLARAKHNGIRVALDTGRMEDAVQEGEEALALTQEVYAQDPENIDAIYAHAQSEFWVGEVYKNKRQYNKLQHHWIEYNRLAQELYNSDKNNLDWIIEAAHAANNLGSLTRSQLKYSDAENYYKQAIDLFEEALLKSPENNSVLNSLQNALGGRAFVGLHLNSAAIAQDIKRQQITKLGELTARAPENAHFRFYTMRAKVDYPIFFSFDYNNAQLSDDLRSFKNIIDQDGNNETWRNHILYRLFEGVQIMDEAALNVRQDIYTELVAEHRDSVGPEYKFFYSLVNARLDFLRGDGRLATEILKNYENAVTNREPSNSKQLYYLMMLSSEIGNFEMSSELATKYLGERLKQGGGTHPYSLNSDIHALNILGKCQKALAKVNMLEKRGFKTIVAKPKLCTDIE